MKRHIISQQATLRSALAALNALSGGAMTLLAVDGRGSMTGTLTDGDVRRALLAGASLDDSVVSAINRRFHSLRADAVDVEALARARDLGIRLIPLLNSDGAPVRIIDTAVTTTILPLRAVIMAGGRGERLRPLTLTTPKPLLSLGGRAIIDYNVAMLARAGIDDVTVTTHYLAEQLEAHFAVPVEGVCVKCVREETPLGTIGAVRLAGIPAAGDTLVMNSDLLTTVSLEQMWLRHVRSGADLTVATVPYSVSVPYAILDTDSTGAVTSLMEKPSYSYEANAGIYIISNRRLRDIPADRRYDATDLIDDIIASGGRVVTHPVGGVWIDIGSPDDFRRASELLEAHRHLH